MTDYKTVLEDNKDNTQLLQQLVQEVNSWDGSLDTYEVYDFDDDFFDTYFEGKPEEAARAVFFGKVRNWMDEYIRFNAYANLESLNVYQYDEQLLDGADEIISCALELADSINLEDILQSHELLPTAA